jgi:AcrR family transcriptional regulator
MARPLVDLLWRDHPDAPTRGARGPASRRSTGDVVACALDLADRNGLAAVTVRAVADALSMSAMSVYTHVNSRDDLLVLMVDAANAGADLPAFGRASWRKRLTRVAEANLSLLRSRPWLLDVDDDRVALGPGTIAKYDHELRVFDGTALTDVDRDAALTFVLDFVRASAAATVRSDRQGDFGPLWAESAAALGRYLGGSWPLAQRVGAAAGEEMAAPSSAAHAWEFGLRRVVAGLAELIEGAASRPGRRTV